MRVVVVDPFNSGADLVRALTAAGASCASVQSAPKIEPYLAKSFTPADFEVNYSYNGDIKRLLQALRKFDADALVAGAESGVHLADRLAEALGLPGNSSLTSPLRRDKGHMQAAWAASRVETPQTFVATNSRQAVAWFMQNDFAEAVVKPASSAGSDNVHFCASSNEIRLATERVLSGTNFLGEANAVAVIQERVFGEEYYINSVSVAGRHRIVEIWQYTKTRRFDGPVYDFEEPVLIRSALPGLRDFVERALDALGIYFGASHLEVMMTRSGPVALECGARLPGGVDHGIIASGLGTAVLFSLRDVVIEQTLDSVPEYRGPLPGTHIRYVSLISEKAGTVNQHWRDLFSKLPTLRALHSSLQVGDILSATTSLRTSPGFAYLVSPKRNDVIRDYQQIRSWEADGVYT